MSIARCFCCNAELTAPTIIEGRMYGYTCAAKIQGGKVARKFKLVPAKIVQELKTETGYVFASILELGGERFKFYTNSITGELGGTYNIDGQLYAKIKR
jgi:hypothetical protein